MADRPLKNELLPLEWQVTREWLAARIPRSDWVECKARLAMLAGITICDRTKKDDETPTQEEIAIAAEKIRQRWSRHETEKRIRGLIGDRSNRFLVKEMDAEEVGG